MYLYAIILASCDCEIYACMWFVYIYCREGESASSSPSNISSTRRDCASNVANLADLIVISSRLCGVLNMHACMQGPVYVSMLFLASCGFLERSEVTRLDPPPPLLVLAECGDLGCALWGWLGVYKGLRCPEVKGRYPRLETSDRQATDRDG